MVDAIRPVAVVGLGGLDGQCYYTQLGGMDFFVYDFLVLLCFELGNKLMIRATIHQLILIVVVVVLTIWRGFHDCTPPPLNRSRYSISPLGFSGTPLVRVMYRDGGPPTTTLSHWGQGYPETSGNILGTFQDLGQFYCTITNRHIYGTFEMCC